jgi:hypothetical protein
MTMEYASGQAYEVPLASEPTIPDTMRMSQALERHLNELSEISAALARIATELFGPPPSPVGNENALKGQGVVDQLHQQIQALHYRAAALNEIVQRFNRLI